MRLNHPHFPGLSIEVPADRVDSHVAAGWLRDEQEPEGPKQEETTSTEDVDPASGEESEED